MSEWVIFNIIYCSLAKQKVLQADHESEVCKYTEQVEILKSKNNVSTFSLVRCEDCCTKVLLLTAK